MAKELSLAEQLCYNTTRIETLNEAGEKHIATGFFMAFMIEDGSLPLLVTNRHVANNANSMDIYLTEKDANGDPVDKTIVQIHIDNAKDNFLFHPDDNVDLAITPIIPYIKAAEKQCNKKLYYRTFTSDMLINDEKAAALDAIEEVIMIGYPNALWDGTNNRPIFRYGITATDPKVDYENRREFMIDCACIQGSSGSPVIQFYKGVYCNKFGKETCYDNVKFVLLGIQHAIPLQTAEGKMVKIETPTAVTQEIPVVGLPINLGYIVKGQCLYDFIPLLEKKQNVKILV